MWRLEPLSIYQVHWSNLIEYYVHYFFFSLEMNPTFILLTIIFLQPALILDDFVSTFIWDEMHIGVYELLSFINIKPTFVNCGHSHFMIYHTGIT